MMKTTTYYEQLIRRLRQRIFDYSDAKQDQCTRLIGRCKARCADDWADRHARNAKGNVYARVMWM